MRIVMTSTILSTFVLISHAAGAELRLDRCLLSLVDDVQVPAQESGVLVELRVHEGEQVESGAVLGRVNDTPARLQRRVAAAERATSHEKAQDDVDVRYADATRQVATSEYDINRDANRKVAGTKSPVEMQKLMLTVQQATLQIEKARHEQKVASLETEANTAKVDLADDEITRRELRAPFAGEVVDIVPHVGEWLKPGDPVLRVIRMDRLRVETFVSAADVSPSDVIGKAVTVSVPLAHGRTETFTGRVVFVDPRVQAGGDFRLWAEVDNRREQGQWLLRPGLKAQMTIATEPIEQLSSNP
jgi:macrolide-specific efflux system membrane fusion protein